MGGDPSMLSAFFSAIHKFGQANEGGPIQQVEFEHLTFLVKEMDDLLFVISFDDDNVKENVVKLDRIADIFTHVYGHYLTDGEDAIGIPDTTDFDNLLIDLKIAQRNCGGRPLCEGCPNARVLPLDQIIESFQDDEASKIVDSTSILSEESLD
ncbi:MAG: hypothetical protein ACXAEE_11290 [Candidatus Thorarchaeota archaeon]